MRHNRALHHLYQVLNSTAMAYQAAFVLRKDKTYRILYIPNRDLRDIQRYILSKILANAKFSDCVTCLLVRSESKSGRDAPRGKARAAENGYFEFL